MFRSKALLLAACTAVAGPVSAVAELAIYEPFDYTTTAGVNNGAYIGDGNQAGGTGLGLWRQNDNNGNDGVGPYPSTLDPVNESDISDGGLTYSDGFGYDLPVAGNAWERTNRVGQTATYSPIDSAATTALTADNTSVWMTFLFQDRGFSGPDFVIGMMSETMVGDDNQSLGNWDSGTQTTVAGYGVGFSINSVGGPARAIGTALYDNSVGWSKETEDPLTPTFDGPGASDITYLAMKVNWNESGTPDEIHVFNLTGVDLSVEPDESTALASQSFDWDLATQQSLDWFNVSDTQVSNIDEIRLATTFEEAIGGDGGPPALPGDTDGDGDVDDSDLGTSFSNYTGPVGDVGKTAADGDNDGDGDVDDSDLGTSFSNYTGPIAVNVPEPTSLALLTLGGLLAARRRRA